MERAAARGIPRLELWQKVAGALLSGELPAANLAERIGRATPIRFFEWLGGSPVSLGGFRASVDRGNDPNRVAHILRRIMVPDSEFQRWLRTAAAERRGPRRGTTGYQSSDRKQFAHIEKLMQSGAARSAYGAALQLFDQGKIKGNSRISAAKRVSALFRRENP
ncbi:MAG: hypothetical protein KGK33_07450 [Hyphomicrobiales bacterium]|nr:hypothetical protein [Hyphomicrobiales bacterium]